MNKDERMQKLVMMNRYLSDKLGRRGKIIEYFDRKNSCN